jgi:hypothetical protein
VIVFDDWQTYQLDLSRGVERGYWEPHGSQGGGYWTGLKTYIRFDFLEGYDPWLVHLDYVLLTGDDTANAAYTVRWSQLQGSALRNIDFYTSQNQATCLSSGSLIYHWSGVTGGTPPPLGLAGISTVNCRWKFAADNFVWKTAAVTSGAHFVCAE